jgi:uncharacterized protein (TIGR00251 family)
VIITVRVKPNARASELVAGADGAWEARLKAPPVDGKANAELVALVAARFGCAKSAVSIRAGAGARTKRVEIAGR